MNSMRNTPPQSGDGSRDSVHSIVASVEQDAETIRSMIRHENELINARMGWMTTSQGLLFAAFSVLITRKETPIPLLLLAKGTLFYILPILGIAVSGITIRGVWYAQKAIRKLRQWWCDKLVGLKKEGYLYQGPPEIGFSDEKISPSDKESSDEESEDTQEIMKDFTRNPSFLMPSVFILAWFVILVVTVSAVNRGFS